LLASRSRVPQGARRWCWGTLLMIGIARDLSRRRSRVGVRSRSRFSHRPSFATPSEFVACPELPVALRFRADRPDYSPVSSFTYL
jgi:hypothetical protein